MLNTVLARAMLGAIIDCGTEALVLAAMAKSKMLYKVPDLV